jgi:DEAD/DEAH box helicase domain-containing protein
MIEVVASNDAPDHVDEANVKSTLLTAFRSVMPSEIRKSATPFTHQACVFNEVWEGKEVRLVAGTAAGKTLAIAVPLFEKLFGKEPRIGKIILLYPTRALLADQRRVMDELLTYYADTYADVGRDEIGLVQGGMTRSQLVTALSRRVVVATPDAVFWFFRKNVKYSSLLVYGLLQVDEIVVDEAHLFDGLSLRNLVIFVNKLRRLGQTYFDRSPRVHFLTATSNDSLKSLNQGILVPGRSKCGAVATVFEACELYDREEQFEERTREFLGQGKKRVLVVCNSARRAHRIFDKITDQRKSAPQAGIPDAFWVQFGLTQVGVAVDALADIQAEAVTSVRKEARNALSLRPKDLAGQELRLRSDYVVERLSGLLQEKYRALRRVLWQVERENAKRKWNHTHLMLALQDADLDTDWRRLGLDQSSVLSFDDALSALDAQMTQAMAWIASAIDQVDANGVLLAIDDRVALRDLLLAMPGADDLNRTALAEELALYFQRTLTLDGDSVADWSGVDFDLHRKRLVSIRRFLSWVDASIRPEVQREIIARRAQHQAIGVWRDDERGTIVILYTGSMARYAREGLVELFKDRDITAPMVLISTSAVEVGVDFEADAMVTEECVGSSFLQRFGRVGRREGIQGTVHVFVSPSRYPGIVKAFQTRAGKISGELTLPREDFSNIINETFPIRKYVESSVYLDALHYLVNEQLGQVGQRLNETWADKQIELLATEIRDAGIEIAYGLRGTLPQVSLRDEGVGGDPFYILQYVDDRHIAPPSTPFEVARADIYFQQMVYGVWDKESKSRIRRKVFVDAHTTLEKATAMGYLEDDHLGILTSSPLDAGKGVAQAYRDRSVQIRQAGIPRLARRLYARKAHLPPTLFDRPDILLAYGDIYLAAGFEGSGLNSVRDYQGNRVRIPDQWFLILLGAHTEEEAYRRLAEVDASDREELYVDVDGPELGMNSIGTFVIERQAGACFEVWERMAKNG